MNTDGHPSWKDMYYQEREALESTVKELQLRIWELEEHTKCLAKNGSVMSDCYCVCHSPTSSRGACEHCNGINEASFARLQQRIAELEAAIKELLHSEPDSKEDDNAVSTAYRLVYGRDIGEVGT